jgi:hypothetical protein
VATRLARHGRQRLGGEPRWLFGNGSSTTIAQSNNPEELGAINALIGMNKAGKGPGLKYGNGSNLVTALQDVKAGTNGWFEHHRSK